MNLSGIGVCIADSSEDEAKCNGSTRLNQIVFRRHLKSISIECNEPPKKPRFSPEKYRIPSQLLYLDNLRDALLPSAEGKGKAVFEPPLCMLPDSGCGKAKAPLERLKPELGKRDSLLSRLYEKKSKTSNCKPSVATEDIKLSDYHTCVTNHGSEPRVKHVLVDMVLECDKNKAPDGYVKDSIGPDTEGTARYSEFLSHCFYCNNKLQEGEDIYFCRYLSSYPPSPSVKLVLSG